MRSAPLQSYQAVLPSLTTPPQAHNPSRHEELIQWWPLLKMLCQHLNSIGSISCQHILLLRSSPVTEYIPSKYDALTRTDTMLGQCHRQWANLKSRCESVGYVLASLGHWCNVGLMLVYCMRRWGNFKPALVQFICQLGRRLHYYRPHTTCSKQSLLPDCCASHV